MRGLLYFQPGFSIGTRDDGEPIFESFWGGQQARSTDGTRSKNPPSWLAQAARPPGSIHHPMMPQLSRKALRQHLRQTRRGLDAGVRAASEAAIVRAIARHPRLGRASHLAMYWPADGEVDLRPLVTLLARVRRQLYLPILSRDSRLRFAPWGARTRLAFNRFGIPEPRGYAARSLRRPSQLDAVLLPLVGFDEHGNRLGMGGGFYDRSFAFRLARRHWRKPLLIGVAFELQRCPSLPVATWDVPLDGIVTEHGLRLFQGI